MRYGIEKGAIVAKRTAVSNNNHVPEVIGAGFGGGVPIVVCPLFDQTIDALIVFGEAISTTVDILLSTIR